MIPEPSTIAGDVETVEASGPVPLPPLLEALIANPVGARASTTEPAVPTLRLPPGLHAGFVESHDAHDGTLRVALLDGRLTRATRAPHVHPDLLSQCIAQRSMVLLSDADPPLVIGALQTTPSPMVESGGSLTLAADRIHLRANQELRLEAGINTVLIEMGADGKVRLRCERGIFDVAANLRIYSALVELP
jgi:hypothetical protein